MSERTENVICTFCGCLCDDIIVEHDNGKILKVLRACANGQGHFREYDPSPLPPRLRGKEVSWGEAYAEASAILRESHSPLVYGLSSAVTEAQRRAIELADRLGAVVDSTSSVCHGPTGLAMQGVGEPTCTLGEVRNRADLLLYWGCNPAASHPRHFARYSTAKGRLTPDGRVYPPTAYLALFTLLTVSAVISAAAVMRIPETHPDAAEMPGPNSLEPGIGTSDTTL